MKPIFVICLTILLNACGGNDYTPKPHAYPRTYLPEKQYYNFDTSAPYSFQIPTYSVIKEYSVENEKHPYWYNIYYLPFNATLHLSYLNFKTRKEFDDLFNDTRKLVYKHDIKAEEIDEIEIHNEKADFTGIIYELKGNTATNLNFYVSDGKKHFLRGALYFNSQTKMDSIQPYFDYLKTDVVHLINTIRWKEIKN